MVINEEILYSMGAEIKKFSPTELIFREGDLPSFYFQIIKGEVKLNSYNEEGKELIQNILGNGQCIGESLLFMDKPSPMNAIALNHCTILKLSKFDFFRLLKYYPDICMDINKCISQRLYFKLIMAQTIHSQNPAAKLKVLLDYLKSFQKEKKAFSFQIPLTRQQIASLTGICVETAIRTIKSMERDHMLKIINQKIMY
ncbi:Crp/Fnr family transcriptional regulator [Chryseobacterium sp.]|uniref:Crp/Fnr family transcriptional regulator n=1 Tax=Chryseobacterium sp. TaxID=1871047 RepID=UPI0025C4DBD1|nr:Crp/Fnr family transcriptional regulator [Chryseobacterium sp.]